MILSGQTIRELGIISEEFSERTKFKGLTYGLGPAGYDVRVEFDSKGAIDRCHMAHGQFLLCSTIEKFKMPDNVMGIVHDKSTWARLGLAVQNTVIEPGWEGWLTLELTNHGHDMIELYRGCAIAQVVFHRIDQSVEKSYDGKYHNQRRGPVRAIIES